jgi:uncharacterized protein
VTLVDSGALFAVLDPHDHYHSLAVRILAGIPGRLLTTWAVVSETLYLVGRDYGWPGQATVVRLVRNRLDVADLDRAQGERSLALMERYADQPMDFADATLVALAEARGERRIFTFDHDFYAYRLQSVGGFSVLGAQR